MSETQLPHIPFRYDVVGSFLRPASVKQAREQFAAGKIGPDELRAIEDAAIVDLIGKQKASGLRVITDGEFRRSWWHLDFMWGLQGLEYIAADKGYEFVGETTRADSVRIADEISGENHPFVEHYKFVKAQESGGVIAKQTIPAPAQTLSQLQIEGWRNTNAAVYKNDEELIEAIGAAYRTVISDLYAAGCRNIQFDDCTWGLYLDKNNWEAFGFDEASLKATADQLIAVNNLAIRDKPDDLVIATHVCRGNYHSHHAFAGAYDPIAPYLFAEENVDAYYLEFDDARSGSFDSLRFVSDDKKVVLGLVTTKHAELEDEEAVIERINEAAEIIPLERLALSPQCGFASTEEGNQLTEDEQWAKVRLVRDIARRVWDD